MSDRRKGDWSVYCQDLATHNESCPQSSTKRMLIASLLLLLALVFSLVPLAQALYYESEINPRVIHRWEVVGGTRLRADGTYFVVSKNPDSLHSIKYVLFKIYYPDNRLLIRYAYYKHGELFVYELDYGGYREGECYYVRAEPTPEERKEIDRLLTLNLE